MDANTIVIQESRLPVVLYYAISMFIFAVLYYGKIKVTRKKNYFIFILYSLWVIFCTSLQFGLFTNGTSFAQGFLHLNLNVDLYDSIHWGALFYSLLYLLAAPKNIFIKYM